MKQYYLETLKEEIETRIVKILDTDSLINVELATNDVDADLAVPCFAAAKKLDMQPEQIAQKIADNLKIDYIQKTEIDSGYLNIWLDPLSLAVGIAQDFKQSDKYGAYNIGNGQTVISEFPSPNMAKPYSVGHLRPALQGWALYKLMQNMGYEVVSDNHLGDYGTPFGKWAVGFKMYSSDQKLKERGIYELADVYIKITEALKKEKETGEKNLAEAVQKWLLKLEAKDNEAIQLSNKFNQISLDHMHKVLNRLNIKTDLELGESFYVESGQQMVNELLARGVAKQGQDGSVIVPLDNYGIKTPMLIRKSNGAALYATTDMATMKYRVQKWSPKKAFLHVGSEQKFYFEQLFALAKVLGYGDVEWNHIWHGAVDQITDGKREKMSSRKGVVLLEELIDIAEERAAQFVANKSEASAENAKKVALGAIKFNDFIRDRRKGMLFDWDTIFSLQGRSGPYVQYAAVRIKSIVRKSSQNTDLTLAKGKYNWEAESKLLLKVAEYPLALKEAAETYQAHKIANYLYDFAKSWNRYYETTPILGAEPEAMNARLTLLMYAQEVFKNGLDILGIEIPDSM